MVSAAVGWIQAMGLPKKQRGIVDVQFMLLQAAEQSSPGPFHREGHSKTTLLERQQRPAALKQCQ